jgi:hypothetical protein
MFGFIWPFDWSCSGFFFFTLLMFGWFSWAIKETVKDVAKNETVQEVGKGVLAAWLDSMFNKK